MLYMCHRLTRIWSVCLASCSFPAEFLTRLKQRMLRVVHIIQLHVSRLFFVFLLLFFLCCDVLFVFTSICYVRGSRLIYVICYAISISKGATTFVSFNHNTTYATCGTRLLTLPDHPILSSLPFFCGVL